MSWEPYEGGYERSRDPELIEVLLNEVREMGLWVQFVTPDFRSGPTLLLEVRKGELIFDLPRPWDPHLEGARVVYRDKSQIIHSFRVYIIRTDPQEKVVLTTRPREIYRLQRRRFYRIRVPVASRAIFRYGRKEICAEVFDVSGDGMAILLKEGETLAVGGEISDIRLELFLSPSKAYDPIHIKRGRVVRKQSRNRSKFYGIEFLIEDEKDREPLLQYVLKREIDLCRARSPKAS